MKHAILIFIFLAFNLISYSQRCDSETMVNKIEIIVNGISEYPDRLEVNIRNEPQLLARFSEADKSYSLQLSNPRKIVLRDLLPPEIEYHCYINNSAKLFFQIENGNCTALFTLRYTPKYKLEIAHKIDSIHIYEKPYKENPLRLEYLTSDSLLIVTGSFGPGWVYRFPYSVKEHAKKDEKIVHGDTEIRKYIIENPYPKKVLKSPAIAFIKKYKFDSEIPIEYWISCYKNCK